MPGGVSGRAELTDHPAQARPPPMRSDFVAWQPVATDIRAATGVAVVSPPSRVNLMNSATICESALRI